MVIIVTGATGFIGRDLVKRLKEKGHNLSCLVRSTSNIKPLKELGVNIITADILNIDELRRVFKEIRPEAVYHAAAIVSNNDEKTALEVNTRSTSNICEVCLENGVRRFIYLSSVSVISGNHNVPLVEDLPYKASNAYGRSKIEAEKIVIGYRVKGLRAAVIRPCMVYGEGEPHALDNIFSKVRKRRFPVLNIEEMDALLNLVYIGNVTDLLELVLWKEEALEGTFMVADKDPITMRRFLEILYDELGAGKPPVIPRWLVKLAMAIPPARKKIKGVLKDRVYDISRAREKLGYTPRVGTEEGLRQVARAWKVNRKRVES